jgi:hypothetical protein
MKLQQWRRRRRARGSASNATLDLALPLRARAGILLLRPAMAVPRSSAGSLPFPAVLELVADGEAGELFRQPSLSIFSSLASTNSGGREGRRRRTSSSPFLPSSSRRGQTVGTWAHTTSDFACARHSFGSRGIARERDFPVLLEEHRCRRRNAKSLLQEVIPRLWRPRCGWLMTLFLVPAHECVRSHDSPISALFGSMG